MSAKAKGENFQKIPKKQTRKKSKTGVERAKQKIDGL